ncbi:MAG: sigma-70 family RNA polymerase sigma factor [Clostridiales bacterium]|nr:sigma-70 family RNA polymerase sigma factor [Clostridiales bacterium]
MAEKEKYIIKVEGKLVEVTPEVYYAYFRMERQERGQEEKKQQHDVFSYDALDNGETVGIEAVPDLTSPSMEERAVTREICEKLHRAVDALPRAERELIQAIYFDGFTEKEYAVSSGLSQQGVSYRLRKILSKLRNFMDFIGSF